MLMKVVVENGVKKLVPLTADAGSGNPCGTIIAVYSNQVPYGYLPCNGVAFDTAQFPVLYALLGDNHTPDLRECTLKGTGESGRTVGAHVKAGGLAVGEFIDDRVQTNAGDTPIVIKADQYSLGEGSVKITAGDNIPAGSAQTTIRGGATTEVKAVGVNFCIKATSGINENQADNVLSALTPVDTVALNNLHSVTSNAVAQALNGLLRFEIIESESFTINAGSSLDVAVTIPQINGYSIGVAFYFRNQSSNALYSGKYIITIGGSSGTAWMSNPTNNSITTKIEVMVMYIKQIN